MAEQAKTSKNATIMGEMNDRLDVLEANIDERLRRIERAITEAFPKH